MKATIKSTLNGYILSLKMDDEGIEQYVFADTVEGFQELLFELNNYIGPSTSRYSAQRIQITIEPGDKFVIE